MTAHLPWDGLARPVLLLFLVPALLFIGVVLCTAVRRRRRFLWFVVAISRAFIGVALLVLAAGPWVWEEEIRPGRLEVMVDLSASEGPDAAERAVALLRSRMSEAASSRPPTAWVLGAFAEGGRLLAAGAGPSEDWTEALASLDERDSPELPGRLNSDPRGLAVSLDAGRDVNEDTTRWIVTDGALPEGLPRPSVPSFIIPSRSAGSDSALRDLVVEGTVPFLEGEPVVVRLTFSGEEPPPLSWTWDGNDMEPPEPIKKGTSPHASRFELPPDGLTPGWHRVVVRTSVDPYVVACAIRVIPKRRLIYVAHGGEENAAPLRALRAQQMAVDLVSPETLEGTLKNPERISAVILDRLAPEDLTPSAEKELVELVRVGRGFWLIPRSRRGDFLAWSRRPLGRLLPVAGLPPPPETPPKTPRKPKTDPKKGLSRPDPKKSHEEEREAPTLILLFVIDKSSSMKEGSRLHFAKRGAIATLARLHPEDRIGVISYNTEPTEVVPVQPVGQRDRIVRSIQRIRAQGGTNIERALKFAKRVLDREEAAVKTVVLLSDGQTPAFDIRKVCESLVTSGISVNTIGVGSSFDRGTLTQIAKYGRGTGPIPAHASSHIPAVMVDLANRIVSEHGARRPEDARPKNKDDMVRSRNTKSPDVSARDVSAATKPAKARWFPVKLKRPASYLVGLDVAKIPALSGLHPTRAKDAAWVSLVAGDEAPLLAHWRTAGGWVAASTAPVEGSWAQAWPVFGGYARLVAQIAAFLEERRPSAPFETRAIGRDDLVVVSVEPLLDDWRVAALLDEQGEELEYRELERRDGMRLLRLSRPVHETFLTLDVQAGGDGQHRSLVFWMPPSRELEPVSSDAPRALAEHWGARVVDASAATARGLLPRSGSRRHRRSVVFAWIPMVLAVFGVELLLKRMVAR